MCYAYPGPRCSNHTKAALVRSNEKLLEALESQDLTAVIEAHAELDDKQKEFDATPEGLNELGWQLDNAVEAGNATVARKLKQRIELATEARDSATEAYKKFQADGILPKEKPQRVISPFEEVGRNAARRERALQAVSAYNDERAREAAAAYVSTRSGKAATRAEKSAAKTQAKIEAAAREEFEHARTDLKIRAERSRYKAGRSFEDSAAADHPMDKFDTALSIFSNRVEATVHPKLPGNKNLSARNRIAKQLWKLEKNHNKVVALGQNSNLSQEEKERIAKVNEGFKSKRRALRYDLDLLATEPRIGEHPKLVADRALARRRWDLMGSIDKLLA